MLPLHFGSTHFRKLFLLRFLSYLFILSGTLTLILIVEPVTTEELAYQLNQLTGRSYILAPRVVTSAVQGLNPLPDPNSTNTPGSFGTLLGSSPSIIVPVSTKFGVVIEKINANAQVIENVDPTEEREYATALTQGVAHAKGTSYPGQNGNIYLFSHSVDAPWNIIRFNAIFYLLNKLEKGDSIVLFYQGRRYDYVIFDKTIAAPADTKFLTNKYEDSVLTLQTCDPPGTLLNRLVVRAKLASN